MYPIPTLWKRYSIALVSSSSGAVRSSLRKSRSGSGMGPG